MYLESFSQATYLNNCYNESSRREVTAMSKSILITDDNFDEEVFGSKAPVLVDFWAEWCGPCRTLGPVIEEIAEEYKGQLKVGKLNVDDNPGAASYHGIRGIPTLILFKEGKPVEEVVGAVPKEQLVEVIECVLDMRLSA
ncbi:MAG: thioredoxin [Thermodesulfobacteriota bacterium]